MKEYFFENGWSIPYMVYMMSTRFGCTRKPAYIWSLSIVDRHYLILDSEKILVANEELPWKIK